VEQLRQALAARDFTVRICKQLDEAAPGELCVIATGGSSPLCVMPG